MVDDLKEKWIEKLWIAYTDYGKLELTDKDCEELLQLI